mmetsp:Transcript_81616/g.264412  ORF Transcript_81616/g.264412 Transcript_81616/m.264412 type:complete len:799 (-) Transcript_81616:17-2413(-)
MAAALYRCIRQPCLQAPPRREERVCWLSPDESYWVPELLDHQRLTCGIDCKGTWGRADCSCVLLDEDYAVLAVVGPHGLSAVDGVSLDCSGSSAVVSFWLGRLNRNVRQLLFVVAADAAQRPPIAHGGLPSNTAGPSTVHFSRAGNTDQIGVLGAKKPEHVFCSMRVQMPPCLPGTMVVLASFRSGADTGEPFRLNGIGKTFVLEPQRSLCLTATSLRPVLAELAHDAVSLPSSLKVHDDLPAAVEETADEIVVSKMAPMLGFEEAEYVGAEGLAEPLAAAGRLAKDRLQQVMLARKRTAELQDLLSNTVLSLQKVRKATCSLRYDLEAWNREAMMRAHAGEAEQVAASLPKLPEATRMRELLSMPDIDWHIEDPASRPRMEYRIDSCPPATIVGDTPLLETLREEELADFVREPSDSEGSNEATGPLGPAWEGVGEGEGADALLLPIPGPLWQEEFREARSLSPSASSRGRSSSRSPGRRSRQTEQASCPSTPSASSQQGSAEGPRARPGRPGRPSIPAVSGLQQAGSQPQGSLELSDVPSSLEEVRKLRGEGEDLLQAKESEFGPEHLEVAKVLVGLACLHAKLGETQRQKQCLDRALAICEREHGPDHIDVAFVLTHLGNAEMALDHPQEQKRHLERALRIKEATYGPDHPSLAATLTNLASAHSRLGEKEGEKACLERILCIKEKEFGQDHPKNAVTMANLGNLLRRMGDAQQAARLLERSVRIKEEDKGPNHPDLAATLVNLGTAYGKLGDEVRQQEVTQRAVKIFERAYGPDHSHTVRARKMLSGLKSPTTG